MEENYAAKKRDNYKNKIYGLLCEREKEGSWEQFLENILLDLANIKEENRSYEYYELVSKLSFCKYLSYKYYRKILFECIRLVDRVDFL